MGSIPIHPRQTFWKASALSEKRLRALVASKPAVAPKMAAKAKDAELDLTLRLQDVPSAFSVSHQREGWPATGPRSVRRFSSYCFSSRSNSLRLS